MINLVNLEKRIEIIEARNRSVEIDKKWETSKTRRVLLMLFTFIAIGTYMQGIGVTNPWMNALIPTLGFLLSTLTLPFFRRVWESNHFSIDTKS